MQPEHRFPSTGVLTLRALRRYPDRTALRWDAGALSYRATEELIGRYQQVFHDHGLRRGQRVALLTANRADTWCASVAAQACGMAITWLHALGSREDHLFQIDDAEVSAVVVDERNHAARGREIAAAVAGEATVFSAGPSDFGIDLAAAATAAGSPTPVDLCEPDDIALLKYTGGTTGNPKGTIRRQRAASIMFATGSLAAYEVPRDPRYYAVAPMSHVAGTMFLPTLLRGGTIHLAERFSPGHLVDTVQRERITMSLLVPTMIYTLLDDPALSTADLSSLELLIYGASPMSPTRLAEGLDRLGPVFSQAYGQTECYPIATLSRADHLLPDADVIGSCGVPAPSADVRIVDDAGAPVAAGTPGEIVVHSPAAMDGYWKLPEHTAETVRDGWVHTGDIGVLNDRGYLSVVDRKRDMIITGGFNVYSREVEDTLGAHADVGEAAVFGVPDAHWGEAVTAAVVARPGHAVDPRSLIDFVRDRKGSVQAPKRVHLVDELPRTSLGKVDKKRLREELGARSRPS